MTAQLVMTQEAVAAEPERWLKERLAGLTASEIAPAMGLAPKTHASPFALYVAKSTGADFTPDNDEMLRGRHLEPYVADRFAEEYLSIKLTDGGLYRSAERPWQMATFDRIGSRRKGATFPVQLKTANSRYDNDGNLIWGDPGTADIPRHYRAQCLQEMDVWDASEVLVPCLFMNTWQLHVYRIVRDRDVEADLVYMREAALEFLGRVRDGNPPPIDWTPATTRALRTLHPVEPGKVAYIPAELAEQYKAARRAMTAAERQMAQATNEILAATEGAREIRTLDGDRDVKVATRTAYNRHGIDADKLRQLHPRVAKKVEKTSPVDALYPGTWTRN